VVRFLIRGPVIHEGPMLHVPKDMLDVDAAKNELTISNAAYWTALNSGLSTEGIDPKLILYRETKTYLEVPRNYKVPYNRKGAAWMDEEGAPIRVGVPPPVLKENYFHSITLRDEIQSNASFELQRSREDKILSLACGIGKTVVSLHAAAEKNLFPILVVVHTEALMSQWRREIEKFLCDKEGTAIRVGHVQAGVLQWEGFPIAVAMLHTLVQKRFTPKFYSYWRLVIIDEVHRTGAQTFGMVCSMFPAERWGLSATLKRGDGMDAVIQLHLGQVCYSYLTQPLKPKVYFVKTHVQLQENKFKNYRSGRINLPKMINVLSDNDYRNQAVLSWINRCVTDGRTVLVLGERVGQLHWFYENCTTHSKSIHVGAMTAEERLVALTKQVVFATQHLAKEGLDRPAFDTLFILIPFGGEGRLRQSIGRILRIEDGKKTPYVFVFEDAISIMNALCNKMRRHLKNLDFSTKTLDISLYHAESSDSRGATHDLGADKAG
jgi:superfamily II DNA or RNA helicase